jgi:energy-converting hydrogenase Eha subunit B
VASASLAHFVFGEFSLAIASSLLVGAVPGAYLGARACAHANDAVVRSALTAILTLSALKLLNVSNESTIVVAVFLFGVCVVAAVNNSRAVRERLPAA